MKNIRLRVETDGTVHISAPYGVSLSVIDSFVESRKDWINEKRAGIPAAPVSLSEGSVITLFGRQLAVRIIKGSDVCVEQNGELIIAVSDIENEAKTEEIALAFIAGQTREVLEREFRYYLKASGFSGNAPLLKLKVMKSRWGSCNRSENIITLNMMLCKLPVRFSAYVAAHEVTHLFVPNHSPEFYRFGERLYPGFLKADRELNRIRLGGIFS